MPKNVHIRPYLSINVHTELEALLTLNNTPGLGSVKIRQLLNTFGSAESALHARPDDLKQLPGFGPQIIKHWNPADAAQQDLELADKANAAIIPFTDARYPKHLLSIPDFPPILYVKGSLTDDDLQSVAIIGTRAATHYGLETAFEFGKDLAENGLTVISGLARGVDTQAHEGARKTGRTIAVLGSGLCRIYPRENIKLAEIIADNGAVISEFPMNTPPDRMRFPQRNRIVSGLSSGLLLIEAPLKSGAMITMRLGKKHGKPLYVLPGRADNPNFDGNHSLLKTGQAKLVTHCQDILDDFQIKKCRKAIPSSPELEPNEKELLKIFPKEEIGIDELASRANLPIQKLNVLLMGLILKKQIKEYPGRVYKILRFNY